MPRGRGREGKAQPRSELYFEAIVSSAYRTFAVHNLGLITGGERYNCA